MNYFIGFIAFLCSFHAFAQSDADLYRFSKTNIQGDARFEAMGGAFGALGANLSSSQINPAGFGRYSNNFFGGSLSTNQRTNTLTFNGNVSEIQNNKVNLNTLGVVFVKDQSMRKNGFLYSQFGMGYNKVQDFNNSFSYSGEQFESLLDVFAANAAGIPKENLSRLSPFSGSVAYATNTILPVTSANANDYIPALNNSGNQIHNRTVNQTGRMNEFYASYSGNYMNKLYIGANIGLQTLRYSDTYNHTERVSDQTGNDLVSFNYRYSFETRGMGFNAKIGVIYLPTESLRIGLAIHTPTAFDLTDDFDADMSAQFTYGQVTLPDSLQPFGNYNYRLQTPTRIVLSGAYVYRKFGLISADLEFLNYGWANLRSTKDLVNFEPYDFTNENRIADEVLRSSLNFRLGTEVVLSSVFFARAGIRLSGRAYQKDVRVETGIDRSHSFGFGMRLNRMTADISYRRSTFGRNYTAFSLPTQPGESEFISFADQQIRMRSVVISIALQF